MKDAYTLSPPDSSLRYKQGSREKAVRGFVARLPFGDVGKGGKIYNFRSGFCVEAQHFPDSVNHPNFPSTVIDPGKPYTGKIVYKFSTVKN
jgi:aldose 1-epimerase